MPEWVSDAADISSVIQGIIGAIGLLIAIIALRAARKVWPMFRDRYSGSTRVDHQSGTVVTGEHAKVNVTQVIDQATSSSGEEES